MRAGTGDDKENLKEERIKERLKNRKDLIQKIMINKRFPDAQQKEQKKIHNFFSPEIMKSKKKIQ